MKKITILGAGRVGQAMAIDLCKEFRVTSADISEKNLDALSSAHPIRTLKTDLSDTEMIKKSIMDADLVIGAVPGFMGFEMAKAVIESGKNIVDISFFNEDIFLLDELAKRNGVIAVMDCGVAPGMDNIILGYHNERMKVEKFECLVGGLPFERKWPYEYKAPFSPIDVIAEYTRPARFVRDGKLISMPALSEPEIIDFPQVGKLEAFNTDGLRSLIHTMNIPNMTERTLRYPGHINYMKVLRESGFFSEEFIEVKGSKVRPIDVTTQLLFPMWKLEEGEDEFTLMRVSVSGTEQGNYKKYIYTLFDRYDKSSNTSSMARSTGYTCTAVARLILNNSYKHIGISPPEYLGKDESCFRQILDFLHKRGVNYQVGIHEHS